jgi:hypothetical protein
MDTWIHLMGRHAQVVPLLETYPVEHSQQEHCVEVETQHSGSPAEPVQVVRLPPSYKRCLH